MLNLIAFFEIEGIIRLAAALPHVVKTTGCGEV